MDWSTLVQPVLDLVSIFLHLDVHLDAWLLDYGTWLYGILALVIFCETGLVVTPFLPGDSLLFACGALIARPDSPLQFFIMFTLLCVAGIIGDAVNYAIGAKFGNAIIAKKRLPLINPSHIEKAQHFYDRYGGKTIIFARFIPIVRTFAPFVAGVGSMAYRRFAVFNVSGAIAWVGLFLAAGYWFGNIPAVKRNFQYVIMMIIALSLLPAVVEWWRARRQASS